MKIFGGTHKNRKLMVSNGIRPTSGLLREALFNICQNYIEGASFLDLFAGSGAMGFEALSRGAKNVVFIDNNKDAIKNIKKNILEFKFENKTKVFCYDSIKAIKKIVEKFDIIYIDPPYNKGYSEIILNEINLLKKDGVLFLEESSKVKLENFENLQFVEKRVFGSSTLWKFINT